MQVLVLKLLSKNITEISPALLFLVLLTNLNNAFIWTYDGYKIDNVLQVKILLQPHMIVSLQALGTMSLKQNFTRRQIFTLNACWFVERQSSMIWVLEYINYWKQEGKAVEIYQLEQDFLVEYATYHWMDGQYNSIKKFLERVLSKVCSQSLQTLH